MYIYYYILYYNWDIDPTISQSWSGSTNMESHHHNNQLVILFRASTIHFLGGYMGIIGDIDDFEPIASCWLNLPFHQQDGYVANSSMRTEIWQIHLFSSFRGGLNFHLLVYLYPEWEIFTRFARSLKRGEQVE